MIPDAAKLKIANHQSDWTSQGDDSTYTGMTNQDQYTNTDALSHQNGFKASHLTTSPNNGSQALYFVTDTIPTFGQGD